MLEHNYILQNCPEKISALQSSVDLINQRKMKAYQDFQNSLILRVP